MSAEIWGGQGLQVQVVPVEPERSMFCWEDQLLCLCQGGFVWRRRVHGHRGVLGHCWWLNNQPVVKCLQGLLSMNDAVDDCIKLIHGMSEPLEVLLEAVKSFVVQLATESWLLMLPLLLSMLSLALSVLLLPSSFLLLL